MKHILKRIVRYADLPLMPLVYPSAIVMKSVRRIGVQRLPRCKAALERVGVFPIRDHYYEPQFRIDDSGHSILDSRELPGINWDIQRQLNELESLVYSQELRDLPSEKQDAGEHQFFLNNDSFGSGDAEYLYQQIRAKKPQRIFEIGSGNSTLMARRAIEKNEEEDANYRCKHVCIEPYEMPWLEEIGVSVLRETVEQVDISFFGELEEDDLLFIDSSHVIRPQGDVLFEYLQLLPTLSKGVIVHVHDIFSPRNYLERWLRSEVRFWNEQYLLEGFLSHNSSWKIVGALNLLHHEHYEALKKVCPYLTPEREPGSFYIQKVC